MYEDEDYFDDIDDSIDCQLCDGIAYPMGKLGNMIYYRCRSCGMDFGYKKSEVN